MGGLGKRKRRKDQVDLRGRTRRWFFYSLLLGGLGYGAYDLWRFVVESDLFLIQEVRVLGNVLLSEEEALRCLEIPARVRAWNLDTDRLEANLLKLSLVYSAQVRRVLPGTLVVDIQERTPIAEWAEASSGKRFVVDEETVILEETSKFRDRIRKSKRSKGEAKIGPLITGVKGMGWPGDRLDAEGLGEILSAISLSLTRGDSWVETAKAIVAPVDERGWTIVCETPAREIRVGFRSFIERVGRLEPVWRMMAEERILAQYVDLRFDEQGILLRPLNIGPKDWMEIAQRYPAVI